MTSSLGGNLIMLELWMQPLLIARLLTRLMTKILIQLHFLNCKVQATGNIDSDLLKIYVFIFSSRASASTAQESSDSSDDFHTTEELTILPAGSLPKERTSLKRLKRGKRPTTTQARSPSLTSKWSRTTVLISDFLPKKSKKATDLHLHDDAGIFVTSDVLKGQVSDQVPVPVKLKAPSPPASEDASTSLPDFSGMLLPESSQVLPSLDS
ncbi:uncharacterized protein LOC122059336 [Macadamia integrifolia]|uniref:uncharacterized protein LOC122059336 n=1 Tax=Macadamia integrifolia TaxID=60698 RepID=UPI001C532D8D|nr:uncharacterized protein LOC122059336 [Macadamia integrifolia]